MAEHKKLEEMSSFFDERAGTYDDHMIKDLDLNIFYEEVTKCLPTDRKNVSVLDLGCGTGLELEGLFSIYPNAKVTAIDLSKNMLKMLKHKYESKRGQLNLICGSYFDIDFGLEQFDIILSTYSLHHFSAEVKSTFYKKIYNALKDDGICIEGDYIVDSLEKEQFYIAEDERLRRKNDITDGLYHYDTPLAVQTQIELYKKAGFHDTNIRRQWEKTVIIVCQK